MKIYWSILKNRLKMIKVNLFIFLLLFVLTQPLFWSCENKSKVITISEDCKDGRSAAIIQFSRGNIELANANIYQDINVRYILQNKYGIRLTSNPKNTSSYTICYYNYMDSIINSKYGSELISIVHKESSSLFLELNDSLTPYGTYKMDYLTKAASYKYSRDSITYYRTRFRDSLYDKIIVLRKHEYLGFGGNNIVEFTIDKYGTPKDFQVIKKCNPLADSCAIFTIRNMPRWQPAYIGNNRYLIGLI